MGIYYVTTTLVVTEKEELTDPEGKYQTCKYGIMESLTRRENFVYSILT